MQRLIFEHIDSIGFLEAILQIHSRPLAVWNAKSLALELRNNPVAVEQYLKKLETLSIVNKHGSSTPEDYSYNSANVEMHRLISELNETYRVHSQSVIETIYSPSKKARDFSQAFLLPTSNSKKENNDG